jgi:hypothetical protein
MHFKTTAGTFEASKFVYLSNISLPEFNYTCKIKRLKAFLFDAPNIEYDIIFGRAFLNQVQIDVLSSTKKCKRFQDEIPFHKPDYFKNSSALQKVMEVSLYRVQQAESNNIVIATKSSAQAIGPLCASLTYLDPQQRLQLQEVMEKHQKLFDGSLGCYPKRKFKINLKPDTIPYHCNRPYPVPATLCNTFKTELD